jgi:hypothetical protein
VPGPPDPPLELVLDGPLDVPGLSPEEPPDDG